MRAAVLSLSDISANMSKYSRPCNFDIPQVGEPCFHMNGTVKMGAGKQDAVSPRIWAEAITLASLCCCALWSTDMRGSKPNICRCASGALIIVANFSDCRRDAARFDVSMEGILRYCSNGMRVIRPASHVFQRER